MKKNILFTSLLSITFLFANELPQNIPVDNSPIIVNTPPLLTIEDKEMEDINKRYEELKRMEKEGVFDNNNNNDIPTNEEINIVENIDDNEYKPLPSLSDETKSSYSPPPPIENLVEHNIVIPESEVSISIDFDPSFIEKGRELFNNCSSCHGEMGEKKALGKSQVIAGWDIETTTKALNGYKDGSYGSNLKGVMKGQALKLTDEQIDYISQYIMSLPKPEDIQK